MELTEEMLGRAIASHKKGGGGSNLAKVIVALAEATEDRLSAIEERLDTLEARSDLHTDEITDLWNSI